MGHYVYGRENGVKGQQMWKAIPWRNSLANSSEEPGRQYSRAPRFLPGDNNSIAYTYEEEEDASEEPPPRYPPAPPQPPKGPKTAVYTFEGEEPPPQYPTEQPPPPERKEGPEEPAPQNPSLPGHQGVGEGVGGGTEIHPAAGNGPTEADEIEEIEEMAEMEEGEEPPPRYP